MSQVGEQRRCTQCRQVYEHREGTYGLVCPHCRAAQDDRMCHDPDCVERAHRNGSAGCVNDPTCGRGTAAVSLFCMVCGKNHPLGACGQGVAQSWPPPLDPSNPAHLELHCAAASYLSSTAPAGDPPHRRHASAWERLCRAAVGLAGLAPGLAVWERERADLKAARAEIVRLTEGLRAAESKRDEWCASAGRMAKAAAEARAEMRKVASAADGQAWEARKAEREACAALVERLQVVPGQVPHQQRDPWLAGYGAARHDIVRAIRARGCTRTDAHLISDCAAPAPGAGPIPSSPGVVARFREVPVTRRVRLECLGRVRHVRPDGKGRGWEIGIEEEVPVPLREGLMDAMVCVLGPLAGGADRGRWRVVKWRAGHQGRDGSLVVSVGSGPDPQAVVAGDWVWLEVPVDG